MSEGIENYRGTAIMVPNGMDLDTVLATVVAAKDAEGTSFSRLFKYRPFDGAAAFQRTAKKLYGTKGIGTGTETLFGKRPPQRISVKVGLDETISIPWGEVTIPSIGVFTLDSSHSFDLGALFLLSLITKSENEDKAEAFFDALEAELQTNSIYRGKAIDGQTTPDFIDLTLDESKISYNAETTAALERNLWMPLQQRELMKELDLPVKRALLLEGGYGTGKTTAVLLSAQKGIEHGWTFIYCRPQDDYEQVMQTARLYPPALVLFEDIDRLMDDEDPDATSVLLDVFDGIKAKSTEIMVVATTNHIERIHTGMFRPGRLDAVLKIGACDAAGVETLLRMTIKKKLLKGVDLSVVSTELQGMTPAFVREAGDRAVRNAVCRVGGRPEALETEDFLAAARELSVQKQMMENGTNDRRPEGLGEAMERTIRDALNGIQLPYSERTGDRYVNADAETVDR